MQVDRAVMSDLAARLGQDGALLSEILKGPGQYYHKEARKKKYGGRRLLMVPSEDLRGVQRSILARILSRFETHECSHCCRGRSIITNAGQHLGGKYVSVCDLANCFPSVTPQRVANMFRRNGVPEHLVHPLTSLCTFRGELPQGAPTSNSVLNALLYPLDDRISRSAHTRQVVYTRYVDDMTFSSKAPIRPFIKGEVSAAVRDRGFRLAMSKTRHWRPGQIATVTGVQVSTSLGPRRTLVKAVARQLGKLESGRELNYDQMRSLLGQIAWIHALWPLKAAELYKHLFEADPEGVEAARHSPPLSNPVRRVDFVGHQSQLGS
jgi:RNA-directed DNA polymerase